MAKYGEKAKETVEQAMHKFKKGKLKSGKKRKRVTSREQAIAIALSEARAKGAKVPPAPKRSKSLAKKAKKIKRTKRVIRKRTTKKKQ